MLQKRAALDDPVIVFHETVARGGESEHAGDQAGQERCVTPREVLWSYQ